MREEGLHDNAAERGAELVSGLRALRSSFVHEVRGVGLMIGLEFADPDTGAPASVFAKRVRAGCFERGLLCELGGRADATLRLLPPLVITRAHVEEALRIIGEAIRAAETRAIPREGIMHAVT
jgi:4-aminobutyrate aminotransferase-like enzyme